MKALDLKVSRIWDSGDGTLYADAEDPRYPKRVGFEMLRRRFSDAELAAELYRAAAWVGAKGRLYASEEGRNMLIEAAFTFGPITRDEHEWDVMNRFLHLPYYDEEEA